MNITYTPEKIDEFVKQAEQILSKGLTNYQTFRSKIINIKIINVLENQSTYDSLLEEISNNKSFLEKAYKKFFDVVDLYEVGEYPKNVYLLEETATKIDHVSYDIGNLKDSLENIISAVNDLKQQVYNK